MTSPASRGSASPLDIVANYGMAQVIHVAIRLRVADLVAAGTNDVDELARATQTHGPSLARLIRMMAALELIKKNGDGRLSLTPTGELLRADVPGSVRDRVLFLAGEWFWRSWGELLYSVQTGQPAFDQVFGMTNFEYWEHDARAGEIHDASFSAMARSTTAPIVAAYDYSRFATIADIGGSEGPLLAGILAANPAARGILFDLPHVVAGAARVLDAAEVADRCTVTGGDFFTEVPKGADAYILKYILHDWDDERGTAILRRCREAMSRDATLLVIEQVAPDLASAGPDSIPVLRLDLQMLVLTSGGRERTAEEFRQLLAGAGFELRSVLPTRSPFRILEATPT